MPKILWLKLPRTSLEMPEVKFDVTLYCKQIVMYKLNLKLSHNHTYTTNPNNKPAVGVIKKKIKLVL